MGSAASCNAHTWFNEEPELYIFRILSCELSVTDTHKFTSDCIKSHASWVKTLNCGLSLVFHMYLHFISLQHQFTNLLYLLLLISLPSASYFAPCRSVLSFLFVLCCCSLSASNAVQPALLFKYMSQKIQSEWWLKKERQEGDRKLAVICTDGGTPAL